MCGHASVASAYFYWKHMGMPDQLKYVQSTDSGNLMIRIAPDQGQSFTPKIHIEMDKPRLDAVMSDLRLKFVMRLVLIHLIYTIVGQLLRMRRGTCLFRSKKIWMHFLRLRRIEIRFWPLMRLMTYTDGLCLQMRQTIVKIIITVDFFCSNIRC